MTIKHHPHRWDFEIHEQLDIGVLVVLLGGMMNGGAVAGVCYGNFSHLGLWFLLGVVGMAFTSKGERMIRKAWKEKVDKHEDCY